MTEAFEQAKREFADKWRRMTHSYSPDAYTREFLSDLTALISEDYVEREAYMSLENTLAKAEEKIIELLQQRDELKEALINVMVVVRDCYPLLFDNEKPAVKQAESAIKNTEKK